MRNSIILFFALLLFANSLSNAEGLVDAKVVYGKDNRQDFYQIKDETIKELSRSTVALVESYKLEGNETQGKEVTSYKLKTKKFGEKYRLCESEAFYNQPLASFCSGFLVSENKIVTAGHCVRTQRACDSIKFVFDYKMNSSNDSPSKVPAENVFSCKSLVYSVAQGKGVDFAVIELDRPVVDRTPLKLRSTGSINSGEEIFVLGHPVGLPLKLADDASVRGQDNGFFVANLDTYGGNSGSAVFHSSTHEVEGILVRGEMDFEFKDGCRQTKFCKSDECRGEDVTHITEVLDHL